MKHIRVLLFVMALSLVYEVQAQSKKELKEEIEQLKQQNQQNQQMMQMMMQMMQNQQAQSNQDLTSTNGQDVNGMGVAVQKTRVLTASETKTGADIRAYGRDKSTKSQFARNKAENQARNALARQMEAYARYAITQYNEETQAAGNTGLDVSDQELAVTAAKKVVEGASILDSQEYYDKSTKMYTWEVCVAYDRANLISVMEEQSSRIKKNKAKFEADCQKYFDDLDRMQGRETETEQIENSKNKLEQSKLDAQHKRDMESKQQDADNAYRENESSRQADLQSQKQFEDTSVKMQKQKNDADIKKGYTRNLEFNN